MDIFYVYKHIRVDTGKCFYVGSSIKKQGALKTPYPRAGQTGTKRTEAWGKVFDECGRKILIEIDKEFTSPEAATAHEESLIKKYGMTHQGKGCLVNQVCYGRVYTDAMRKARSEQTSGRNHYNYGKKLSKETCDKKSKALIGKNHHLYGKKLSKEWIENIRESKFGKNNPNFGKRGTGLSRKIKDIESGKIYISVSEAAEVCGYKMKTLYNWLSGHRKNPTSLRFV